MRLAPSSLPSLARSQHGRARRPVLFLAALASIGAPLAAQRVERVNTSLDFLAGIPGGDVDQFELVRATGVVVYLADEENLDFPELRVIPKDGSASALRPHPPVGTGARVTDFVVTPDGQRILSRVTATRRNQLFSTRSDGVGNPVRLHGDLRTFGAGVSEYVMDPSGALVAFVGEVALSDTDLFVSPTDGSAPATVLSTLGAFDVAVSPNSQWVAFLADTGAGRAQQLYAVPTDASGSETLLNGALPTGQEVRDFVLLPQGDAALFTVGVGTGSAQLYLVDLDGSAPPVAIGTPQQFSSLHALPNGQRALAYVRAATNRYALLAIDLTGAASWDELSGASLDVHWEFDVSPDGSQVAFQERTSLSPALFVVPTDASAPPTLLSTPAAQPLGVTVPWDEFLVRYTPDGSRALARSDDDEDGELDLVLYDLTGGATNLTQEGNAGKPFRFTPDGRPVFFQDDAGDGEFDLYVASADGSTVSLVQDAPIVGEPADGALAVDDELAIFHHDIFLEDVYELGSVRLDGVGVAVKLSGELAPEPVIGDVTAYRISPDGKWALYFVASPRVPSFGGTFVTRLEDGAPVGEPIELEPGVPMSAPVITSDSSWIVFFTASPDYALYRVAIDGSSPAIRVSHPAKDADYDWLVSPNDEWVVYRARDKGLSGPEYEVWASRADGSGVHVELTAALATPEETSPDFVLSPDSQWVAFVTGGASSASTERALYVAKLDGSFPASVVNEDPSSDTLSDWRFTADSTRVVYRRRDVTLGKNELVGVRLDSIGTRRRLSNSPPGNFDVLNYELTPDGRAIVFREDDAQGHARLYANAVQGPSTPVRLDAPQIVGGEVLGYMLAISPDGTRVAFAGDRDTDGVTELYTVPIDGSSAPARVNDAFQAGAYLGTDFAFSSDGRRVLYRASPDLAAIRMFSGSSNGGGSPIALDDAPVPNGNVTEFVAGPRSVVWRADSRVDEQFELFGAAYDGTGRARRMSLPMIEQGDVVDATYSGKVFDETVFAPGSDDVYFIADQAFDNAFELFFARRHTRVQLADRPLH